MDLEKRKLIKTIHVDRANFDHISSTGNINGTLLIEIERVMELYAKQVLSEEIENSWREKLRVFLEGLEVEKIEKLMIFGKVGDYRNLAELITKRIKRE